MQKKSKISDQKLVRQYILGNNVCLKMLIERHQDKIFGTIMFIVKDRYIAEDIFQETFIKVSIMNKASFLLGWFKLQET